MMSLKSSKNPPKKFWRATSIYLKDPLIQSRTWADSFGHTHLLKLDGKRYFTTHHLETLKHLSIHGGILSDEGTYRELGSPPPPSAKEYQIIYNALPENWLKSMRSCTAVKVAHRIQHGGQHPSFFSTEVTQVCLWSLGHLLFGIDLRRPVTPVSQTLLNTLELLMSAPQSALPIAPRLSFNHRRRLTKNLNLLSSLLQLPPWIPDHFRDSEGCGRLLSLCAYWISDVSVTAQWFWIYLSRSEPLLLSLQNEVDQKLGDRAYQYDDLQLLPLLHSTLLEVLRVVPPKWSASYMIIKPLSVEGWTPHPKARLLTYPYWLHHQPSLWPNPHQFDPQRFINITHPNSELPWSYCPFGFLEGSPHPQLSLNLHLLSAYATTVLRRGAYQPHFHSLPIPIPLRQLTLPTDGQCTFQINQRFIHIPSERI